MSDDGEPKRGVETARQRRVRQSAELRANLAKRKALSRAKARSDDVLDEGEAEPGSFQKPGQDPAATD